MPANRVVVVVELKLERRVVDNGTGASDGDVCGGAALLGVISWVEAGADAVTEVHQVAGTLLERCLGFYGERHGCRNDCLRMAGR